jgi:hypothetical protein
MTAIGNKVPTNRSQTSMGDYRFETGHAGLLS